MSITHEQTAQERLDEINQRRREQEEERQRIHEACEQSDAKHRAETARYMAKYFPPELLAVLRPLQRAIITFVSDPQNNIRRKVLNALGPGPTCMADAMGGNPLNRIQRGFIPSVDEPGSDNSHTHDWIFIHPIKTRISPANAAEQELCRLFAEFHRAARVNYGTKAVQAVDLNDPCYRD